MFGKKKSNKKRAEQNRRSMAEDVQTRDNPKDDEKTTAGSQTTLEEWLRYWGETYSHNMHSSACFRTFV